MEEHMKYIIKRNIDNFLKFSQITGVFVPIIAFFSALIECAMMLLFSKSNAFDLGIISIKIAPALFFVLFLLGAFKKKYIVFSRKNHFQNFISIIFILLFLIWYLLMFALGIAFIGFILLSYSHAYID